MQRRVLAFDFDGTLAENGVIPVTLQNSLERLHAAGHALFLVTGRRAESVALGALRNLFTGIVWENGAVLYDAANGETYLPFGQIDRGLVDALSAAGVPLEHGQAIVATWLPHNDTVWHVINAWGGDAAVIHNKAAVMILPAGAAKGAGLAHLLKLCGFSPRNLASFGDAENDLSLLELGELGVAVADAVPALQAIADLVTTQPGPAGVQEALDRYWLNGSSLSELALPREKQIPLGEDEEQQPVAFPCTALAGSNLGIFGDSGTGKSWVAGLLAEGMHHAGYQLLLIDPEGDFRGLQVMAEFVAFSGNQRTLPAPAVVATVLESVGVSVVLDLCEYPISLRGQYLADLLRSLRALRERKFRPHWILLEEAQHFMAPVANQHDAFLTTLLPMLAGGGWGFVSYCPDQLAPPVLAALDRYVFTRLHAADATQPLCPKITCPAETLAQLPRGSIWLPERGVVRLSPHARRTLHIRHLYKYLDNPLPGQKRFHFRDERGYLGIEAASLFEFLQLLPTLPLESLAYHQARHDFAIWAEGALGDADLAAHLRKLAHRPLKGEALRMALVQRVTARYTELHQRL